jgi:hypothetical protein
VIADDVEDAQTHREKLADPDLYRSYIGACRNCHAEKVHSHCLRERILRPAGPTQPRQVEEIRLYRCPGCGAVYTVLPLFIARHLWRDWETVQSVCEGKRPAPRTTKGRWCKRLHSCAKQLIQAFLAKGQNLIASAFRALLPHVRIRLDLVETLNARSAAETYATLAAWIQRVEPGLRLM